MKSHTTARFRKILQHLPKQIREQARTAYQRFTQNPFHPSLHFKQIHSTKPVYSVRINIDYRAVGILDSNEIVWFWVGGHTEYENLIARL